MGLSISILFLSYFELFKCVKNRLNLLPYREFRTFRNIHIHAAEHPQSRYGYKYKKFPHLALWLRRIHYFAHSTFRIIFA